MEKKTKQKKRNPTDLTLRNAKSYNKRLKRLEDKVVSLEGLVKHLLKHTYC